MILYKAIKYLIIDHCVSEFFKHFHKNLFHKFSADDNFAAVGRRFKSIIRYIPEEDADVYDGVNYFMYTDVIITDRIGDEISFVFTSGAVVFLDESLAKQTFPGGSRSHVDSNYCMFGE